MMLAWRSRLKINVTLTLMPAAMVSSIAGMPSSVAGILIRTFGRPRRSNSAAACLIVDSVSWARSGDTSIEMNPSPRSSRS